MLFPAEEADGPNQTDHKPTAKHGCIDILRVQGRGADHYLPQGITEVGERHSVHYGYHEVGHHLGGEENPREEHHGNWMDMSNGMAVRSVLAKADSK